MSERAPQSVVLVVDVANVMGSRPDGWWRDRAGAAARLVGACGRLPGRTGDVGDVGDGQGGPVRVDRVVAVVEGRARQVPDDVAGPGVTLVRAPADGDTSVVQACRALLTTDAVPLAVTADRGLRDRLPAGTLVIGPRALLHLLDQPE